MCTHLDKVTIGLSMSTPSINQQYRRNMKAETITKDEFHVFVEEAIKENKARKGRAFFYKKPKRYEILGEKRVMRFDTKGRQ